MFTNTNANELLDALDILQSIPGYDSSFNIIYHKSYIDYEEYNWVFVLEKDGTLYEMSHASGGVTAGTEPEWVLVPLSDDEAIALIAFHEEE